MHPLRILFPIAAAMLLWGCGARPTESGRPAHRRTERLEAARLLDRAAATVESHPDSAQALLTEAHPGISGSRPLEARYRLLLSRALHRQYIDQDDDSLILPALDYFRRHGSHADRAQAWYYYARCHRHAGDTEEAVRGFTTALAWAEKERDDPQAVTLAAMLHHSLGELSLSQRLYPQAERHFAEAAATFDRLGDSSAMYSLLMQSSAQYSDRRPDEALRTAEQALRLAERSADTLFTEVCRAHRVLYHVYLDDWSTERLAAARDSIDPRRFRSGLHYANRTADSSVRMLYDIFSGIIFLKREMPDSASRYLGRAIEQFAGRYDSSVCDILRLMGMARWMADDPEGAYLWERRYASVRDSILQADGRLPLPELEQRYREEFSRELKRDRRRYLSVIWALAGTLAAVALWSVIASLRRSIRRRDHRLEEQLALVDSLLETRSALSMKLDERNLHEREMKTMLEGRLAMMRDIAATWYAYGDTHLLADKMRALALSPQALDDIECMADLYNDGAVTRLPRLLPDLTQRTGRFAALVIAGFSPQEISVLLDMSLNGVYTSKSKLKRRIASLEGPEAEKLARFFG